MNIQIPDIGDFEEVSVLVKAGDTIKAEQSLITVESDKASMEIPSSHAGVVGEVLIKVGDTVKQGSVVLTLQVADAVDEASVVESKSAEVQAAPVQTAIKTEAPSPAAPASVSAPTSFDGKADLDCDLLVLGAGPGGYSAAFRAADLGLKVILVERYAALGGVCLNVGCIPSKALLHVAAVMDEVSHMSALGIDFGAPSIDIDKLRGHKDKVVGKLTGGLAAMAKMRKVTVVRGYGSFVGAHRRNKWYRAGENRQEANYRLQDLRHRGRLASRAPPIHAARPTRGGQYRRAGAEGCPQTHANPGRRHYRVGDGHRLQHAWRAPGRGGNA